MPTSEPTTSATTSAERGHQDASSPRRRAASPGRSACVAAGAEAAGELSCGRSMSLQKICQSKAMWSSSSLSCPCERRPARLPPRGRRSSPRLLLGVLFHRLVVRVGPRRPLVSCPCGRPTLVFFGGIGCMNHLSYSLVQLARLASVPRMVSSHRLLEVRVVLADHDGDRLDVQRLADDLVVLRVLGRGDQLPARMSSSITKASARPDSSSRKLSAWSLPKTSLNSMLGGALVLAQHLHRGGAGGGGDGLAVQVGDRLDAGVGLDRDAHFCRRRW